MRSSSAPLTQAVPFPSAHVPGASVGPDQWVGATTNQVGAFDAVSTTIDVTSPSIPSPGLGYYSWDWFGVGTTTTGSDELEFGYIEIRGDTSSWGPYPFYVDTSFDLVVVCGPGPLAPGPHTFSTSVLTGTDEWEFTVDGSAMAGTSFGWGYFASCNGPSVTGVLKLNASSAYENAMTNRVMEVGGNPSQGLWSLPTVTVPVAFSVHSSGAWTSVPVGLSTGSNSTGALPTIGVQGAVQDSALSSDEFAVGSSLTWIGSGKVLWAPLLSVSTAVTTRIGTAPLTTSFTASASGGTGSYSTYAWSFGDSTVGQGETVGHTYAGAGTYSVSVTVTDSAGESATSSPILVTVNSTGSNSGGGGGGGNPGGNTGSSAQPASGLNAWTYWVLGAVLVAAIVVAVVLLSRRKGSPPRPSAVPPPPS